MDRKYIWIMLILFIICTALNYVTCDSLKVDLNEPSYNNPIKIGFLSSVTLARYWAESHFYSLSMAAEEINNAGGVMDRDIEIVFRDDGGSADIGISAAQQLFSEGINIIVGPLWSSVTLAVAPQVSIPNGMLLVSPSATNPMISTLDDNGLVWRTCPSDVFQGRIGADYCYNTLGKKTAGIIVLDNSWAFGLADSFKESFEALGGTVSAYAIYPEFFGTDVYSYDYSPHLDELFADSPELIYYCCFSNDGAQISNDIALGNYIGQDYNPTFFSNDGPTSQSFIVNGHPDILEGMLGTLPSAPEDDPNNTEFTTNFRAKFGYNPPSYESNAYDALYLVAYAIVKSSSTIPSDIAAELRNISGGDTSIQGTIINVSEFARGKSVLENGGDINYQGASGKIDFDVNGDPGSGTYVIWKIENGQYITETTVIFP